MSLRCKAYNRCNKHGVGCDNELCAGRKRCKNNRSGECFCATHHGYITGKGMPVCEPENMECCVCSDAIDPRDSIKTPCGHTFHKHCIGKWFNAMFAKSYESGQECKPSCPMCRSECGVAFITKISPVMHRRIWYHNTRHSRPITFKFGDGMTVQVPRIRGVSDAEAMRRLALAAQQEMIKRSSGPRIDDYNLWVAFDYIA